MDSLEAMVSLHFYKLKALKSFTLNVIFIIFSVPNPETIKKILLVLQIYMQAELLLIFTIHSTPEKTPLSQNGLQLQVSVRNYHSFIKINYNEPIWSC